MDAFMSGDVFPWLQEALGQRSVERQMFAGRMPTDITPVRHAYPARRRRPFGWL